MGSEFKVASQLGYSAFLILDARLLSHDVDVVKDYTQDPLVHNFGSFGLLRYLFTTPVTLISEHSSTFRLPVLITHGSSDQITSPEYSESFIDQCASLDKKFERYIGGYHELHNEIDEFKIPVVKSYIRWIKAHSK
jgi:acylglycerol lipase